jgi:hypothetical protein
MQGFDSQSAKKSKNAMAIPESGTEDAFLVGQASQQ